MNRTWFTADTHFGHKRIIELCKRPFSSVEEMDREMIRRWNRRVAPLDTVIHVGDFSFASQWRYLEQLNGIKYLVVGNHDPKRMGGNPVGWDGVEDMMEMHIPGEPPIVICHYGLRVWNKSHYGSLHLYGHSHGNLPGDSQSLDVGVDCWDFYPVSLNEIKERMATLPKRVEPDHHQLERPQ